jgi:hypothetical protein
MTKISKLKDLKEMTVIAIIAMCILFFTICSIAGLIGKTIIECLKWIFKRNKASNCNLTCIKFNECINHEDCINCVDYDKYIGKGDIK